MAFWAAAAPAIGSAIGAMLPAVMGNKRKTKAPDVGGMMNTIQQGAAAQRNYLADLQPKLREKLDTFRTGATESFGKFKEGAAQQIDEGRTALSDMRNTQGTELARTLQERAFRPVRGATEFVRQNLATTKSGAAQEALAAPTIQAQQQYGQALNDLSQQLLQGEIDLADQANKQKLDLVEQELGFEQGMLSAVFQFGTEQDKALARELMEIQSQETANTLQTLSMGTMGQFVAGAANNQAAADRDAALWGAGGNLAGSLIEQIFANKGTDAKKEG